MTCAPQKTGMTTVVSEDGNRNLVTPTNQGLLFPLADGALAPTVAPIALDGDGVRIHDELAFLAGDVGRGGRPKQTEVFITN